MKWLKYYVIFNIAVFFAFMIGSIAVNADTFGIKDSDIVTRAGDHKCSALHDQGDWANNLCHIGAAEIAEEVTDSRWAGVAVLVAKELTDKNIDYSDIWTSPLQVNRYTKAAIHKTQLRTALADYVSNALIFTSPALLVVRLHIQ